ncbi:MAG: hypothetical protein R3E97_16770 [Candidatus Eisenbacteria bacterium]
MKKTVLILSALLFTAGSTVTALAEERTTIPDGVNPAVPSGEGNVPCDTLLRYDDGSDDTPGSGPTLGYYSGNLHQFLGVVFTPPSGGDYEVQSASWFSDFWVLPGTVDVTVSEMGNPSNSTTASIAVNDGGTWEVAFETPICVPAGSDYVVMVCPRVGCFGVVGEDLAAPDGRSYWSAAECAPVNASGGNDYMIWSCVTPCGPTPIENESWGGVKSIYLR